MPHLAATWQRASGSSSICPSFHHHPHLSLHLFSSLFLHPQADGAAHIVRIRSSPPSTPPALSPSLLRLLTLPALSLQLAGAP
jgi:hypothetical protein